MRTSHYIICVFKLIVFLILNSNECIEATAQTKRAVVIGLGSQIDSSWGKINGDKDVPFVLTMLKHAHFSDVTTLINEQATKSKIESALFNLEKRCVKGDVVYIHFSGHGQQMTDVNQDENTDKWDECWIPYDAYSKYSFFYRGDKHITDDEIYKHITSISNRIGKRGKLLLVVDACHSGNSYYDINGETIRGTIRKFVIPSSSSNQKRDLVASNDKNQNWIMISACKEYEVNTELKNPKVGKLTYALSSILKNDRTYINEALLSQIQLFIDNNAGLLEQTPELSGYVHSFNISEIFTQK